VENPFESGHIKNYLLLYGSVVVIMVLFFIANSLFYDVKQEPKKVFKEGIVKSLHTKPEVIEKKETEKKSVAKFLTLPSD